MTRQAVAWMTSAACAEQPGLPWTKDTALVPSVLVELMHETCRSCPVRRSCAAHVKAARVEGGFWAGRDRDPHPYADLLDELWVRVEWLPVKRSARWQQAALPLAGLLELLGAA